jgi:DNA-binding Lrp family transcriptional regulator
MPSELFGTSVIFVKVAPGYVERTLTTLRAKPNVAKAEAVFGRHDIAIAGGFRNQDELRAFASEVQSMDHVWAFRSYPALADWTSSKANGHASNAYLLIRSNDTQKTMSALKNVPEIQEIISTTGDQDIVARISADARENLLESVVTKVQGAPGVLSTETLPAFSNF